MTENFIKISILNDNGEGIAFTEGKEVYFKDALPGETVVANIGAPFAKGSKRCPGTIIKRLEDNKERVNPFCSHFFKCGGCQLQHLSLKGQQEYKKEKIQEALDEVGVKVKVKNFSQEKRDLICRYKTVRYFKDSSQGLVCGFYKARSHELEEVVACPLEPLWFGVFITDLLSVLNSFKVTAYNEIIKQGVIRNLMLRDGKDERLALLSFTKKPSDFLFKALQELGNKYALNSFSYFINDSSGNKILSDSCKVIYANDCFTAKLFNLSFKVSPQSFLQVNPQATEELYKKAVTWCGEYKEALALDLCCGVGTMTLAMAPNFKKVIGVEIVDKAIEMAKENAVLNNANNVSFIVSDLKEVLPSLINDNVKAVIVDPARVGLGDANCRALNRLKGPVKLAAIFCSLTALKRDLPVLLKGCWKVHEVQGVDMFPQTTHVETVVLLSKS